MVSDRKLANAMGGKTARACDNCVTKRARWYCPADDAFLCQNCDASVHSANPLARRHERVRLKTSSLKPAKEISLEISVPSWHRGFTRKARTPRGTGKHAKSISKEPTRNPLIHLVPEICCDEIETSHEEDNEEQLLYRVPIFDPFVAELCTTSANSNDHQGATNDHVEADVVGVNESKVMIYDGSNDHNQFHGSLPSDVELAEFAADVESLLGKGLDDESFDIEGLGLGDCKEADLLGNGRLVKDEYEGEILEVGMGNNINQIIDDGDIDMSGEPFELSFDYDDSPTTCEEENKGEVENEINGQLNEDCKGEDIDHIGVITNKKILLRLNYDGVISAWADQKSPWTTGERPVLDSNDCWPDCSGTCGTIHNPYGEMGIFGHPAIMDGGREARVSRYREKRRTRLFSKKIRYEVRKLNAEKRPRMKGRFVKRANFSGTAFPLHTK
ncbi:hypothetical protein ACH5RR_030190 [Cinchona calisaya]|uniref:Uncharacterized protein n=1 Tax=Cinchona calisaya TaxID=153742 RepID=A0ABD2YWZ2_9GENT